MSWPVNATTARRTTDHDLHLRSPGPFDPSVGGRYQPRHPDGCGYVEQRGTADPAMTIPVMQGLPMTHAPPAGRSVNR